MILLFSGCFAAVLPAAPGTPTDPAGQAFEQLYSFHFDAAHEILDAAQREAPDDPLLGVARSAVYLFSELDRLGSLASEFFRDRGERLRRKHLSPDAELRAKLHASTAHARRLAEDRLLRAPNDTDALFALAMTAGIECNYAVFVRKKRMGVLSLAKRSHEHALQLLERDPAYADARVVIGTNEYLVSSLPFFVRWFVRFREIEGSERKAVAELRRVAQSGKYFMSFAKILLVAIHLREQRWQDARNLLDSLVKSYPDNPLFRAELARLDTQTAPPTN